MEGEKKWKSKEKELEFMNVACSGSPNSLYFLGAGPLSQQGWAREQRFARMKQLAGLMCKTGRARVGKAATWSPRTSAPSPDIAAGFSS